MPKEKAVYPKHSPLILGSFWAHTIPCPFPIHLGPIIAYRLIACYAFGNDD